jgi:TPR repeat protein
MKKINILVSAVALMSMNAFAGNSYANISVESKGSHNMTYEQYVDYSTLSKQVPIQLDLMNQIIQENGGIENVKKLAKKGYDKPSFVMGNLYIEGKSFDKDIDKGLDILENAAKDGPYSAFSLGLHLLDLDGVYDYSKRTKKLGAKYLYQSASQGVEEAQYIMANLLIAGELIHEDRDMAIIFLNSAASGSYLPAVNMLMSLRTMHTEFREDYDTIQQRATEGYLPSIVRLAEFHYHGWRVPTNKVKAKRLLEYASQNGSEQAAVLLSTLAF